MKKWVFVAVFLTLFSSSVTFAASGRKTVATAGTAEAITSTNTSFSTLTVCAETNNTGIITVGVNSTPVAAEATRTGVPLNAGDCYTMQYNPRDNKGNLATVKLDTTVNTDGVTYDYF